MYNVSTFTHAVFHLSDVNVVRNSRPLHTDEFTTPRSFSVSVNNAK